MYFPFHIALYFFSTFFLSSIHFLKNFQLHVESQ